MKTLQIGKTYKDGCGNMHLIDAHNGIYPFKSVSRSTTTYFTVNGKYTLAGESVYDLIIPDEPEQTTDLTTELIKKEPKVPHLEVILAIVQKIPVQYDYMLTGTWHDYNYTSDDISPMNYPGYNWRIKPQPEPKRTVVIGKRTVVTPEVEKPEEYSQYFYWCTASGTVDSMVWDDHATDSRMLSSGQLFLTEQDAINCQEAVSALLLGKD